MWNEGVIFSVTSACSASQVFCPSVTDREAKWRKKGGEEGRQCDHSEETVQRWQQLWLLTIRAVPESINLSDIEERGWYSVWICFSCISFRFISFFCLFYFSHILHSPQSTIPCLCDKQPPPPPRNCFNRLAHFWPHFFILDTALPFFFVCFFWILKSFSCALSQSAWPKLICSALPGNEDNSEWNTEVVNFLIKQHCPVAATV